MEHVPFKLRRIWASLFPKPSLTFLVYNDTGILLQRRSQETRTNLERQMAIFKDGHYDLKVKSDDVKQTFKPVAKKTYSYLLQNWF